MGLRLTTWNLQGRRRPDLTAVAAEIRAMGPAVVLLQEVRRRQARRLAAALGWQVVWRFKHWPVVIPAEGLAVLARSPILEPERVVLAAGWRFWSSRRRIAVAATVEGARVVDVHLGAGVGEQERVRQATVVAPRGDVIGGDLNAVPDAATLEVLRRAGFRDAWTAAGRGTGHTNWRGRARTGPAVQRLDYVLVAGDWAVVDARVPVHDDPDFERWGRLSDHLPLTVTLERS